MIQWSRRQGRMGDDPPYLTVGTEVSAKYKGAFCEAKVRKVVRSVKCKVTFKLGLGTLSITDDQIRGTLRVGSVCEVRHPERKEFVEAIINKIQDCSQYTVVFDDGDITTLRRTALCLKSGRHFAESETLDQLPLTHPEHFGNPVIGGRKGRRSRQAQEESSDEEESPKKGKKKEEKEADIGKVVCVELGDKKKQKDNWFPGLVVAPTAQDTVRIKVKDEYLVRSFKDGRYFTVPKKEATEFTREIGSKVDNNTLKTAVEKALQYLDKDELPPHWDRDLLFGLDESSGNSDSDGALDSDSSDDEPREEKDHFVAQLYKFMDDRGTPINKGPTIGSRDVDLYKLFKVVHKLGGYNRVTNHNQWKIISQKLGFGQGNTSITNLVKQNYKKFLHSFEDFYRKLGCTMVNHPRGYRSRHRTGRSLIRDRDRATPTNIAKEKEKQEKEKNACDKPSSADNEKEASTEKKEDEKPNVPDEKEETVKVKEPARKAKGKEEKSDTPSKQKSREVSNKESKESSESSQAEVEEKEGRSRGKKEIKSEPKQQIAVETHQETLQVKEEVPEIGQEEERKSRDVKSKPKDNKSKEKVKSSDKTKPKEEKVKVSEEEKHDDHKKKIEKKTPVEEEEKQTRSKSKEDIRVKKEPGPRESPRERSRESRTPVRDASRTPVRPRKEEETVGIKKRGRKRKDTEDKSRNEETLGHLASNVAVCTGDKLKVYYGPTHESKVTYEAKVLEIEEDGSESMYLVHYTGWNTRYDEWIKRGRIADNLSWTPSRAKRQRQQQSQHKASRTSQAKRGRPSISKESTTVTPQPRSTTPSSVTSSSSCTKSPAARQGSRSSRNLTDSASPGNEYRRRTRRMSGHTDISVLSDTESEEYDTDPEPENEAAQTRSKTEKKLSPSEKCTQSKDSGNDETKKVVKKRTPVKKKDSDVSTAVATTLSVVTCTTSCSTTTATSISSIASLVSSSLVSSVLPSSQLLLSGTSAPVSVSPDTIAVASTTSTISSTANSVSNVVPTITFADSSSSTDTSSDVSVSMSAFTISNVPISTAKSTTSTFTVASTKSTTSAVVNTTSTISTIVSATSTTSTVASTSGTNSTVPSITSTTSDASITSTTSTVTAGISSNILVSITTPVSTVAVTAPITTAVTATITTSTTTASFATISSGTTTTTPATSSIIKTTCSITNITPVTSVFTSACFTATSNNSTLTVPTTITAVSSVSTTASTTCIPTPTSAIAICAPTVSTPTISTLAIVNPIAIGTCSINSVTATNTTITTTISTAVPVTITNSPTTTRNSVTVTPAISRSIISHVTNTTTSPTVSTIAISTSSTHLSDSTITPVTSVLPHMAITTTTTTNTITTATDTTIASINTTTSTTISSASVTSALPLTTIPSTSIVPVTTISTVFPSTITSIVSSVKSSSIPALTTVISTTPLTVLNICQPTFTTTCLHPSNMSAGIPVSKSTVTDNSSITISSNTTAIPCTVNTASAGTIAVTAVTSAVSNTVSNIVDSNLNINNNINIINNYNSTTTVPSSTVSTTITAAATIASAMPATISTTTTTTIISPVTSSIISTKSTAVVTSPVYTAANRSIISTASFSTATCMSITTNNSIAALATVADMVRFSATTHVLSSVSPVNTGLVTTVLSQASPITCSTFVTSTTANVTSTSIISNASVCGTSASGSRSSIDTKSNSGNIKYSTLRDLSINVPSCKSQSSKYCKKLLSEKKSFEVKHELKSESKSGAQSDDNQPKGRDFDLNQIRSELKGIEKAVKLPQDVASATGNDDNEEDVTCKTENLENSDIEKSSPVKSEKEIDTDDVYEFKEPEPFEFEVRKRELSDERGSKLHRRPLTRFLDVECPKIEKSCRKRLIPPPKSEPVMSLDIEPRKKLRRTPIKRTENTSESKTVESSSDIKVPIILPVRYISSPKIPTPCEQAFEKLCETPFAVTLKPTSSNNSSPPILSLPDADPDHSSTELTTDLGPLSIFSEAHDDDGEDDNEDRLVISETDDMAEEIAEPLFSYQQRDHEDLFPSLVTSDVSVPTEESTTFHEHEEKSEEPPCLTPVVPGVFHAFDSSMQELPSKSNKVQSPGRDIDCESSSGPVQTSEKLASSKCNDNIKQLLKQEDDEYEDDSINAAIQRAIDQTILNDDDSEIDIFSKESSNRNFKQEAVIETSNISIPKTSENTKILSRKKSIPSHEYTEESDTDSSDEDQRLVIDPMDEETSQHGDSSPLSGLQLRTASESSDLELKLHVNVDNKKDKDIPNPVDTTEVSLPGENSSSDLEFTGREKNSEVISVERKVIEDDDDEDDDDDDDDDDDEDDEDEDDEDDGEDEDDNTDTEVPRKYLDEDSHKEVDDSKYTEVLAPVIVNVNLENDPKVTEADLISENVVLLSTASTAELPCISQNQEITGESIGNSVVPTISSSGKTIGSCNTSHTTILCESVSTSTASPILALAAVPLGEVEATDQQDTRVEDSDSQLLGSLLCQETIPGSPAQVQDTTTDESLSESKVLVLEMPFASVPASSCDSVSPAGSLSIPMSVPLTIPIVAVTATPAITTSTTAVTSIVTDTLPSEEQPTTDTLPSSTVTVTQAVPASSASPPCVLPLSSPGASKHNASEAAALMDNTPPTTPDSSLSTMSGSPRGDHGDMSPPMDNESSKSHRDSFEMDVDSSAEGAKVDHFSEDDSLLNVEDSGTCESRLQGLKLVSKKSVMELDKEIDSSPKKRRRSHKRSESESNKRLRCSTSRNVRSTAAGTGSDSDDTSENSALGCPPLSNTESTLSSKSSRPSKYNFFVELDPELDGSQRIALLQQKLQELRKTYMSVKAELACIDRRRKKLRRREREVEKATKQDVACS